LREVYTALDAVANGYITCLHFNGTRAVNVKPDNGRDAIYEMIEKGVTVLG
jgi:nicotinamidase/pyrazinamidase